MRAKWKKSHFFLVFHVQEREKRGCRERRSDFSLRSTELGWSSNVGPRLKVGVLVEGNVWTPKSGVFVEDTSGKFKRLWVSSFRVFKKLLLRSQR